MLERVNIVGYKYINVFRNDNDEETIQEITEQEYKNIALGSEFHPVAPDGFVWAFSVEKYLFDTPSGELEDGQYADEIVRHVKLAGKRPAHHQVSVGEAIKPSGIIENTVKVADDTQVKVDFAVALAGSI